jgi:hypothetical protein
MRLMPLTPSFVKSTSEDRPTLSPSNGERETLQMLKEASVILGTKWNQ